MKRGLMFLGLLGVVVAMMIVADMPTKPEPANAQPPDVWRQQGAKGIRGVDTYFYSGADTVTAALTKASRCWYFVHRIGADSTAGDTLYWKVHDKTNDAWIVMRTGKIKGGVGAMLDGWRYGPEIDSVYYATPNAAAWIRLECYW